MLPVVHGMECGVENVHVRFTPNFKLMRQALGEIVRPMPAPFIAQTCCAPSDVPTWEDLRKYPQSTLGRSRSQRTLPPVSRSIEGQWSAGTLLRRRHIPGLLDAT